MAFNWKCPHCNHHATPGMKVWGSSVIVVAFLTSCGSTTVKPVTTPMAKAFAATTGVDPVSPPVEDAPDQNDAFKKELGKDIEQIVERIYVQQGKFADEVTWSEILSSAGVDTSYFWITYTQRKCGQTSDIDLGRRERAELQLGLKDAVLAVCHRDQTLLSKTPKEKMDLAVREYLDSILPRPEGLTPEIAKSRREEIDAELKEISRLYNKAINDLSAKRPALNAELLAAKSKKQEIERALSKVAIKPPSPSTIQSKSARETNFDPNVAAIEAELRSIELTIQSAKDSYQEKSARLNAEKRKLEGYYE